jgi:hypothetical protein
MKASKGSYKGIIHGLGLKYDANLEVKILGLRRYSELIVVVVERWRRRGGWEDDLGTGRASSQGGPRASRPAERGSIAWGASTTSFSSRQLQRLCEARLKITISILERAFIL